MEIDSPGQKNAAGRVGAARQSTAPVRYRTYPPAVRVRHPLTASAFQFGLIRPRLPRFVSPPRRGDRSFLLAGVIGEPFRDEPWIELQISGGGEIFRSKRCGLGIAPPFPVSPSLRGRSRNAQFGESRGARRQPPARPKASRNSSPSLRRAPLSQSRPATRPLAEEEPPHERSKGPNQGVQPVCA